MLRGATQLSHAKNGEVDFHEEIFGQSTCPLTMVVAGLNGAFLRLTNSGAIRF
jgi:hypothetical protein